MAVFILVAGTLAVFGSCATATLQHSPLNPPTPQRPPYVRQPQHLSIQPTQTPLLGTLEDQNPAAQTQLGAEHGGHGKYFMYQHVPHKDHYEFGYRKGNEHHFKERYEKAHPHHGHFMTKARWGDKHGGYGEHYWDYNHGGHHGDDGGSNDEGGDESDPVPEYQMSEPDHEDRVKRQHEDVQPAASAPRPTSLDDLTGLNLAYDVESGTVVDESTGRRYLLTPIN